MPQGRDTSRSSLATSSALDEAEHQLRREMTRVAGALYGSGGLLVLLALVTSLGDRIDAPAGVAIVAAAAIVFGVGLWLVGERFPLGGRVGDRRPCRR